MLLTLMMNLNMFSPPVIPAGRWQRTIFGTKTAVERLRQRFDFISLLDEDEYLISGVCTISVHSGSDPTPAAMISGAASASLAYITQSLVGGVAGTTYLLLCTGTTQNATEHTITAFLTVQS